MRLGDGPTMEQTLTMRASCDSIWDACTDPGLPAENSPELVAATWDPDGAEPGIGARLLGRNVMGDREWTSTSYVVAWEPNKHWSYEVGGSGDEAGSQWWWTLTDHGDGTVTVSQKVRLGPGDSGLKSLVEAKPEIEEKVISGRLSYFADAMKLNLEAIEARVTS